MVPKKLDVFVEVVEVVEVVESSFVGSLIQSDDCAVVVVVDWQFASVRAEAVIIAFMSIDLKFSLKL